MPDETTTLRVLVATALGALPLEGATVTVSAPAADGGAPTLLYSVQTGSGGMTPPLTLSTPPRSNSLTPGDPPAYSVYTVSAQKDGYVPLASFGVTAFSGVPSVLTLSLVPLPETAASAPFALTGRREAE